jgi:hypothetical protein
VPGRGGTDQVLLLLGTSFLIDFEDGLARRKLGPARGMLASLLKALQIRAHSLTFWRRSDS